MNTISDGIKEQTIAEFKIKIQDWIVNGDKPIMMISVYTKDDKYVGTLEGAQFYFEKGIIPETYSDNNVTSIGKSHIDGKWYGWSHRAIYGFSIGDIVKEGDCTASSGYIDEYIKEHGDPFVLPVGFEAKTEEDCKKMAIAFASSVS